MMGSPGNQQAMQQMVDLDRRRFMTSSASGLGAAALASLMKQDGLLGAEIGSRPASALEPHFAPKATSCIFIFLGGGSSQLEMFEPKPKLKEYAGQPLPESMRKHLRFAFISPDSALRPSNFNFARYGQSGMHFSKDLVPQMAGHADDICMIRSMHCGQFNHQPAHLKMSTGYDAAGFPSVGAWVTYGLGSMSQNLPMYVALAGPRVTGGPANWGNGFLPTRYQGVRFRSNGEPILYLDDPKGISREGQARAVEGMRQLAQMQQGGRPSGIDDQIARYELAFRMQTAGPELVDLSGESEPLKEAYGITGEGRDGRAQNFSTNCLLARRLVERGVRFVTLYDGGWDQHDNMDASLQSNCKRIDQPIAALLADLKQRGMLEQTLVVFGTEFGRTPLTQGPHDQPQGGRDHHPYAFNLWMAGGGVRGGHVHGETDDFGYQITADGVHTHDFHATLLHLMGLNHTRLTYTSQGRRFRLTDVAGEVVRPILA
ncbi:MAG: DUF1501 domain-containing protein [Phycisphaeraceae bacterium]